MNKVFLVLTAAVSIFVGAIVSAFFIQTGAKQALILEHKSPYDYNKTVELVFSKLSSSTDVANVSIVQDTEELQKISGKSSDKVTMIKYFNAKYTKELVSADERKKLIALMPIYISIYEKSTGECAISIPNGMLISKIYGGETENIIAHNFKEVEKALGFTAFKFTRF